MSIRTEIVRSPSARDESVFAFKAAFLILFWAGFLVFARVPPADSKNAGSAAATETPGEVRFQDLDAADQRMFRLVQEGLTEAENVRGRTGSWPPVSALADQGIPPFTADPIDRAGYEWRLVRDKNVINYGGTPALGSNRRAILVIITEPTPESPSDPRAQADELHHRLSDGTMIHVAIWIGPGVQDPNRATAFVSETAGWKRITTAGAEARGR
ncbi:MAG: hypothetical protein U0271_03700 [Polyangiaceae bacterium]